MFYDRLQFLCCLAETSLNSNFMTEANRVSNCQKFPDHLLSSFKFKIKRFCSVVKLHPEIVFLRYFIYFYFIKVAARINDEFKNSHHI